MIRLDCNNCGSTCGFTTHADYCRQCLFAWAKAEPLPECPQFREKYWRGQELAHR